MVMIPGYFSDVYFSDVFSGELSGFVYRINNVLIQLKLHTFSGNPDGVAHSDRIGTAVTDDADTIDTQQRRTADNIG